MYESLGVTLELKQVSACESLGVTLELKQVSACESLGVTLELKQVSMYLAQRIEARSSMPSK